MAPNSNLWHTQFGIIFFSYFELFSIEFRGYRQRTLFWITKKQLLFDLYANSWINGFPNIFHVLRIFSCRLFLLLLPILIAQCQFNIDIVSRLIMFVDGIKMKYLFFIFSSLDLNKICRLTLVACTEFIMKHNINKMKGKNIKHYESTMECKGLYIGFNHQSRCCWLRNRLVSSLFFAKKNYYSVKFISIWDRFNTPTFLFTVK